MPGVGPGKGCAEVLPVVGPGKGCAEVLPVVGPGKGCAEVLPVVGPVPLPPESLEVVNRTSSSVLLTWEPGYNSSQQYYQVEYREGNNMQTVVANTTSEPLTFNLTDLLPGRTYLVSMRAVSLSNPSNSSTPIYAITAPGRPENLRVSADSSDTLTASWEPGNNSLQDSFEVVYGRAGEEAAAMAVMNTSCSTSPCQFEVGGQPGERYSVTVYALQKTFRSQGATLRHNTAPAAPRNLTGSSQVRGLQLSWEVPLKGVFHSFRVNLTNSLENSKTSHVVGKQGNSSFYSYSPGDLVGGVNYFVQVFSLTVTEASKGSESKLFYTLPEPVSSLSGQAVNTTAVRLFWQNPIGSDYTGLEVNLTTPGGAPLSHTLPAGVTNLTVGDLHPGVEYGVVVVVMSKVQVNSAPVNASVRTEPEVPQLQASQSGEDSVQVTLTGGPDPGGVFDSIQAKLQQDATQLVADGQGVVTFQNLTPGTLYTLEAFTLSGQQASQSLLQTLFTKPRPPQNLYVEVVSSEQLNVTWDAPDRGGVDNYTITLVAAHGAEVPTIQVVSQRNFSFSEVHPGETYNVTVVANRGTQSSVPVLQQNTTTPLPLMHVRVSMKGTDFAVISWDTPTGSVFDGFAYDFPFLNQSLEKLPASPLSVRFEGLKPKSNYSVTLYVFSRRVDGSLLFSEPTPFNFSTYPESVAALQKVDATSDSITVNWTAPVSGRFRMYQLGIRPGHSDINLVMVNASEKDHTFAGLRAGHNYSVAIRTVISRNNYGVPVRLYAVTKPLPVEGLAIETVDAERLRVSWSVSNNSDQDRFTVIQDKDGVRKSYQVSGVEGQRQYQLVLKPLLSGHAYTVTITAIREIDTDIEESLPQVQTATTKPLSVANLMVTANQQTVQVTWRSAAGSRQESYHIRYRPTLRNPEAPWLEQTAVSESSQFSPAFPGERYEVQVIAVSDGQESASSVGHVVVAPLSPNVSVDIAATTTQSVTLQWSHDPSITYVERWGFSYRGTQTSKSFDIDVRADGNQYVRMLDSLTAGVTYTVEVIAMSKDVVSEKMILNATAKPQINTNIEEARNQTTSSQLTFEYRVRLIDVFDSFRFSLVGIGDQTPVVRSREDRNHLVTFTGLQGGRVYTVEAVTLSNGVVSDPVTKNILTDPNNVKVAFQNKSKEIVVGFVGLEGSATQYVVTCRTPNNASCWNQEVPWSANGTTVGNLLPYTGYTILVKTVAGGADVADKVVETSYSVRTAEAAPSEVRQVTVREDDLRTVLLSWTPPVALNGQLRSYRLEYSGTHPSGGQDSSEQTQISPSSTELRLTDLKAGFTYTFKVQAMTVALGPPGESIFTLNTAVPEFRAGNTAENSKPVKPEQSVVTEYSAEMELTNAFSDNNGPILAYTIVVTTDPQADATAPQLPSWTQAHASGEKVAVYQATDNCSDLFLLNSLCGKSSRRAIRAVNGQDSVMFKLGDQSAEECSKVQFCNGPLWPETDYYVKLRAFTQAGYTDTQYSSKIRTADAPKNASTVIIAVVVSVVVVLIIVIVVIVFIIRRKRQPKRATKYQGTTTHTTRPSWENNSLKSFNRPVKLHDFPEHVQKMAADSDFKYAEEYEDLKEVGRDQTCHAAELPANRPKNRFTNILPYDHSRVKLLPTDDEDGSDYINANYMPGFSSKREYIATQGPLPATRDDLWRMVWEQNTCNIVMLTRCTEKGREKSDHYWPTDSEPKYYGDIQVVVLNETHLPDWTITEFRVCLGNNCRQVRHFHYKAWPDFGVPKNHSSLIRFVRMVREKFIKDGGPVLTHCSAGVGRSGTFIVLDHCLQLIREKDEVDIFSIVYSLRRERVLMVQTEQQYKFVHECLACVLEGREDDALYANVGQVNVGFEDDEGINVEVPS
ncbi:hypothetical protein ACOMHN_025537 [Nucella lapillus]